MTAVLDVPTARRLLHDIVAEKGPDHVYQRIQVDGHQVGFCLYTYQPEGADEPVRCIIGEVLHRAGVPDTVLRGMVGAFSNSLDAGDLPATVMQVDTRLVGPLTEIQRDQDEGQPWGQLLTTFDAAIGHPLEAGAA